MRPIVLLSDFGLTDPYVGLMKSAIVSVAPTAPLVDLTHAIPPQDIRAGALVLHHALPHLPHDAVVVAVVDPGVGGPRRPIVLETAHALLLGPDNGLLSGAVAPDARRRAIAITESRYFRHPVSRTFHGRDIFAPVAAHLASGLEPSALGPEAGSLVEMPLPHARPEANGVSGEITYVDRFGNLVTNVAAETLGDAIDDVTVDVPGHRPTPLVPAYASVPAGEVLAVVNSWGLIEIAVRDGSAARRLGAGIGTAVRVRRGRTSPR